MALPSRTGHPRRSSIGIFQPPKDSHHTPEVYIGFQIEGAAALSDMERMHLQLSLVSRIPDLVPELVEVALEIRLIARPNEEDREHHKAIECFMLARLTDRLGSLASVRAAAKALSRDLQHFFAVEMLTYRVRPLSKAEVGTALHPFRVKHTQEIRRHLMSVRGINLPAPFIGVPDLSILARYMLRPESAPTVLAICIEPIAPHAGGMSMLAWSSEVHQRLDEAHYAATLAREYPRARSERNYFWSPLSQVSLLRRWTRARLSELDRLAFRVRMQVASPAPLSGMLCATMNAQVSGLGRTSFGASRDEIRDLAASRTELIRTRNWRAKGEDQERGEQERAIENLERMRFTPWGKPLTYPTITSDLDLSPLMTLADISEARQLLALPQQDWWLPDPHQDDLHEAAFDVSDFAIRASIE